MVDVPGSWPPILLRGQLVHAGSSKVRRPTVSAHWACLEPKSC